MLVSVAMDMRPIIHLEVTSPSTDAVHMQDVHVHYYSNAVKVLRNHVGRSDEPQEALCRIGDYMSILNILWR